MARTSKTHPLPRPIQSAAAWPRLRAGLGAATALWLAACGGGADSEPPGSDAVSLSVELDRSAAEAEAIPAFHAAPLLLDAPADADRNDPMGDARLPPRVQQLPSDMASLGTRGLTVETIEGATRRRALGLPAGGRGEGAAPLAGTGVATYSPAQIRAAYGLPALPAAGATLTAAQAAQLGAGQTIYIVGAKHDPNAAAQLAAFNQKFALPTCTTKAIATNVALPLAAASSTACEFSQVYTTAAGAMTTAAPAYDSGWATEMALDVQWAHATAPLARIVLIEAPDATTPSLVNAIALANKMGPGVVSMSFGANEGSWSASAEAAFTGANMSYVAATGDSGYGVAWPSVSPKVLAVGGTTLTYSGSGARSEVAWSGTGGGISQYFVAPSYQANTVPGLGSTTRRIVADVAFNANPSTGQYVAVIKPGTTTASWISVGGTSLAAPQWAGLLAVGNAMRKQGGKALLGVPHAALYSQVASVPGAYASSFADVTAGTHGSCGTCAAKPGYDELTGLGTPNVTGLLSALSGLSTPVTPPVTPAAPVVNAATVSGKSGTSLSYSLTATAPNAVTWALTNAPSGLAVNSTGVLSWAAPVAGSYGVTATATDSTTGLKGQATITLSIAAATTGPVLSVAPMTGVVGKAFSGTVGISAPGATSLSVALSGLPGGMKPSVTATAIALAWPTPVAGSYSVSVSVTDQAGRNAKATVPITITAK